MNEIRYLSVEDVIAFQDNILAHMGEPAAPPADRGKLESAVFRCRNAAFYDGADLVRQATVLAVGISQAQAFLDGNKRAGFVAADMFLRINGMVYQGLPLDMAYQIEAIAEAERGASRDAAVDRFEAWLRDRVTRDSSFQ